jgi:hypothetical protein
MAQAEMRISPVVHEADVSKLLINNAGVRNKVVVKIIERQVLTGDLMLPRIIQPLHFMF